MSQQHDDDGTVIRPQTGAANRAGEMNEAVPEDSDDGLSLQVGARVAEFEIIRRIGEGGFSIVYLAMDHSLDRTVALKEYMPSSLATRAGAKTVQPRSQRHRDTFEAGLRSFVNEAKLLAQFDHPALVKVYRFWEANGTAYMVMPFYQGVTVKDAIRAMTDPPDESWLRTLLAPLTEALMVIHAEHCYHRDIAPDNVILLAGSAKPLLLDFGAARRVIGDMTQGLTVILKAGYAPVEQYAEVPGMKQGPWTDVYALAAVVYWAVTGGTPPASVGRMMSDSFIPLSQRGAGRYSEGFLRAIDRALILRPEQRTQTIEDLRRDLGLTGGSNAKSPPPLHWEDTDATVIRPVERKPAGATASQREVPYPALTKVLDDAADGSLVAASGETVTGRRRALGIAAVGLVAVATVAIAIWWTRQTSAVPARPPPETVRTSIPEPAPERTVTQEAAQPTPTEPTRRVEIAPTASPEPVAATGTKAKPERSSQRSAAPNSERAHPDAGNKAECGRLFQRLSLGESGPELMDRLKTLKCQ